MVGTWIDGKPLYQKTVDCGYLLNKNTKAVVHGISNLKRVVQVFGYGYAPSSGTCVPIPAPSDNEIFSGIKIWIDTTNILIASRGSDQSTVTECYLTLIYTKTTD